MFRSPMCGRADVQACGRAVVSCLHGQRIVPAPIEARFFGQSSTAFFGRTCVIHCIAIDRLARAGNLYPLRALRVLTCATLLLAGFYAPAEAASGRPAVGGASASAAAAVGPAVPAVASKAAALTASTASTASTPSTISVATLASEGPTLALRCAELAGLTLPRETIALPTRGVQIDTATMSTTTVASAGTTPRTTSNAPTTSARAIGEFCRITGRIKAVNPGAPPIRFDLNLPRDWNGRALQLGGGGYSGAVVSGLGTMLFAPDRAPLAQGYATFGDDSGHVGNSAWAAFGLVDEAVTNFGYAHLKKTHDAAVALILRVYGRPPQRMYFAGASTGGREGYTVMQRFPDDYDGVIADSPALDFSGVRLLGVQVGQAEYATPGGFVPPALLGRVYRRVLAVCDALDGAVDGIVSDVAACRRHEPEVIDALRCHGRSPSADNDDCLTDAQLATLSVLRDGVSLPYRLAGGADRYHGYNVFQGAWFGGGLGLAREAARQPQPTIAANGYLYAQGDGYIRYFVARDATFDALTFDVLHPGAYRSQLVALSQTIGATIPELSRYIARGGKLITLHGLADEVISPNQTIAYRDALVDRFGAARVDSFMRLYMVPGYQHERGVFVPSVDLLGALDNWVTRGVAPETLIATDIAAPTKGRTRPLCRYPLFPRYTGEGDMNRAGSFRCAPPSP
jgi:feruloyl esterase